MIYSVLLSDIPTQYLHECFRMSAAGRVIWQRRPPHHFAGLRRRPRNLKVGKIAASRDGRIRFDRGSYSEAEIAWRLQCGYLPQEYSVRRRDYDVKRFDISNLVIAGRNGSDAGKVGIVWKFKEPDWNLERGQVHPAPPLEPKLSFL